MDLPGHAVDAEAIDAVRAHLQLEHRVGERKDLRQRAAGRRVSVQEGDTPGIVADLKLGLGEDHALGGDPPELGLGELVPAGHDRARQGHRDELAGGDVRGAADDRPGGVAGRHLAHAQPIRVGMGLDG
jgi:hypothetical protein